MATIKVTYNSISRRFNISSATWIELESKLRSLYNIPTTSSLTVSYTDEDGDVITLSSDLELKEVVAQHPSGKPIKLVLSTSTINDWVLEDDDKSSDNNLIEGSPSLQQDQTEEKQTTESRPPSYYQHVSISEEEEEEPEYDQSATLLNKEKESKTKDVNKTQPEKENKENKDDNDEDDEDEAIIFVSYRPSFFGPRFGFFGGPRFGLFDGSFGGGPFNFYGRPQCHRYRPAAYYFGSRQCGPNSCGQKSNTCSKSQSTYNNNNSNYAEASTSASAQSARNNGCNKNHCKRSSRTSCGQNSNFFYPRHYNNQTSITQEQLNEKLSTLHSMGFDSSNNSLYEDLLKRYNGNLERVIELLLRNQQINKHFDNEKPSTNESESEGSKPYIL